MNCTLCHPRAAQDEADRRTPASPDEVADLRGQVRHLEAALSAATESAAGLAREVVTLSRLQISLSRSR